VSGWRIAALVVGALLVLDGSVCLIFEQQLRGMVREIFPWMNLRLLAVIEFLLGSVILFLALRLSP
jgi:hypothetical protein